MEVIGEDKHLKNKDFQGRSLRSLKQGLSRLLGRRSITITEYDPAYKVVYLGNVLTGWAKGMLIIYLFTCGFEIIDNLVR